MVRYLGTAHPQLGQNPTRRVKALEGAELTEASPAVSRVKPQLYPMELGRTPDLFHGQFVPDRVGGLWTFRIDGWGGDPLTTWRHNVTVKLNAGQGESELNNDLIVGGNLLARAATGCAA